MTIKEFFASAGIGAAAAYLFDPQRGPRRRSELRQRFNRMSHVAERGLDKSNRDLVNRARGLAASAFSYVRPGGAEPHTLEERVRATLGRWVRHSSSIAVQATDGSVILSGPILTDEVEGALKAVSHVKGVHHVDNRLEPHDEPGNIPGLQGDAELPGARWEFSQENWSPAGRLMAGSFGFAVMSSGFRRSGVFGLATGIAGAALVLRALTNMELNRIFGIGAGRRAIEFQKHMVIHAPLNQVFDFWANFENVPKFMRNVYHVAKTGDNQWHWKVRGPAGSTVEWDAVVTQMVPGQVLAWKTRDSSLVQHAGLVRFEDNGEGGTRLELRFSYNPGVGALGHVAAKLFGADPKNEIDEDLVRMKTTLETGRAPRDAAQAP